MLVLVVVTRKKLVNTNPGCSITSWATQQIRDLSSQQTASGSALLPVRTPFFHFSLEFAQVSLSSQSTVPVPSHINPVLTELPHFTEDPLGILSAPPVSTRAPCQSHSHIWVVVMVSTLDAKVSTTLLPDKFVCPSCILSSTC